MSKTKSVTARTLNRSKEANNHIGTQCACALRSAIFDSASLPMMATDVRGLIQLFNVGAERMLGYAAVDVVNKITPVDISDPQDVIARAAALSAELDTPVPPGFDALVFKASRGIEDIYELTYIRKDGSRFPAVVSVTALRDDQNAIIGYLHSGTDNTASNATESALRKKLAFTLAIIDAVADEISVLDRQGVILAVNESWRRFSIANSAEPGQPAPHTQVGTNYLAVCKDSMMSGLPTNEEALSAINGITSVVDGSLASFSLEYPCHSPMENRWFSMSVQPLARYDGGVVISHSEITGRKQAEEALLKSHALQRSIFNSVNFSSIATDAAGVIQIFNVGAEHMLGYSAAEVMNKITPADISDPQEVIARATALSAELDTHITPGFEALVFKASRGIEDIYELTYIRKDVGLSLFRIKWVTAIKASAMRAISGSSS